MNKKVIRKKRKSPRQLALSEQRVEVILKAATDVFLESGYVSCSIDDIVERANASKATIYKHFNNKQKLFDAVIDSIFIPRPENELDFEEPDPEKALKDFAIKRFKVVFSPDHFSLLRLVMLEGKRNPLIAKTYQEFGPSYSSDVLVDYFKLQKKRKTLKINDPRQATDVFMSLLMFRWFSWYLSHQDIGRNTLTNKEINKEVKIVMKTFMQLHECL